MVAAVKQREVPNGEWSRILRVARREPLLIVK
jgi:hypothetical protein